MAEIVGSSSATSRASWLAIMDAANDQFAPIQTPLLRRD
jgi:hypothetical protein